MDMGLSLLLGSLIGTGGALGGAAMGGGGAPAPHVPKWQILLNLLGVADTWIKQAQANKKNEELRALVEKSFDSSRQMYGQGFEQLMNANSQFWPGLKQNYTSGRNQIAYGGGGPIQQGRIF